MEGRSGRTGRLLAVMLVVLGLAAALMLGAEAGSAGTWTAVPVMDGGRTEAIVLVGPSGAVYSVMAIPVSPGQELPLAGALRSPQQVQFNRLTRLHP